MTIKIQMFAFMLGGFVFGHLVGGFNYENGFRNAASYIPVILVNIIFMRWHWILFKRKVQIISTSKSF